MDLQKKIFETTLGDEKISLEISKLAGQANGAVVGTYGETVVLATAVMGKENKSGDFFPLTVDYEERFYAAGKIIGSRFVRREGKASDEAVLSARLIDRTIRPLFDDRLRKEVQITVTILSYDEKNEPDVIALLAASTALGISNIPWGGPVAGVQLIKKGDEGELLYNSFFAGIEDKVNMIELEGREIKKEEAEELFEKAQKEIAKLISFQKKIVKEIGKTKLDSEIEEPTENTKKLVSEFLDGKNLLSIIGEKKTEELRKELDLYLKESELPEEDWKHITYLFEKHIDGFVHKLALNEGKRVDGRSLDQIRELYGEVGLFELTHGSGLFIRGNTQVLAVTTLASSSAEQIVETMETTEKKRFMLHYNFPSFSVGETGRSRGPGRREIGHGTLAAKAIRGVIPSKKDFPYTIRVVAETLSSNGSSSMASTCATSLSLMDAGVPIKKHVAGIAIGLMLDPEEKNYKILTDIQGPEDHYGDMDLKVAGTSEGINAIQMDVKIHGITSSIFKDALVSAEIARMQILKILEGAISAPRKTVSKYAPKILILQVPKEKIGEVIGSGGKTINGIIAECEGRVSIDIEEDGTVYISSIDEDLARKAYEMVEKTVKEYRVGEIVNGTVVRILEFGAIVDLGGGKDGMIHVSELKDGFVKKVEDVVHLGNNVIAKVIKSEEGKIGLSLKQVDKDFSKK